MTEVTLMRTLNQFIAKQQALLTAKQQALLTKLRAVEPEEESDTCPRCGASPHSLMPPALMCASCRMEHGNQSWRAPMQFRR